MQQQLKRILTDSDSDGFTLIEVLIVIAIIAIVVAISMPNLKTFQAHSRVNRDARNMLGILQQARIEAVKRNEYCAIRFDQQFPLGTGPIYDYVVFFDDNPPNKTLDAGEEVFLSGDFNFATPTNNFLVVPAAIFNSRGLPSTSGVSSDFVIGTITLTSPAGDGYNKKVTVSKSGRIRIQ